MTYPIVEITWLDAVADSGWTEPGTEHDVPVIRTVGFLVGENARCLTVATSVCPEDHYNATMTIPRQMVLNQRDLE